MKLKSIFLGILIAAWSLSGCDVIKNPLLVKQQNSVLPNTPPAFTDSSTTAGTFKVLLEDCMGHTCSNCPPAVYTADGLIAPSNPLSSHVVLMEEHMGSFADTVTYSAYPDSAFRKDYTSNAGNQWLNEFTITLFPWGMVDRTGFPSNMFIQYGNWTDSIQTQITNNSQPSVTITIHDSCWTSPRIIGADFRVNFKKTLTGTYLLEACIIEDSIIDWQKDNASSSGADTNFVHRNVLRGSFDYTGTGNAITSATTAGSTWTSFQTYDFTKGENGKAAHWNMAHCYIVAFVYNSTTKQVVQAEQIKLE